MNSGLIIIVMSVAPNPSGFMGGKKDRMRLQRDDLWSEIKAPRSRG